MSGCPHPFGHTDPAKRMSDIATLAWVANEWDSVGKWMAFKLADGSSDHTLYPTKRDAVTHQSNEFHCCYIKLHPMGMAPCEAQIMLDFTRKAHDAGFRLADPDAATGGRQLIPRTTREGIAAQIRALGPIRNRRMS